MPVRGYAGPWSPTVRGAPVLALSGCSLPCPRTLRAACLRRARSARCEARASRARSARESRRVSAYMPPFLPDDSPHPDRAAAPRACAPGDECRSAGAHGLLPYPLKDAGCTQPAHKASMSIPLESAISALVLSWPSTTARW
eukprot:5519632-Pleurochrysis_carterae.AAC.1